jgi:hypothetical protein
VKQNFISADEERAGAEEAEPERMERCAAKHLKNLTRNTGWQYGV